MSIKRVLFRSLVRTLEGLYLHFPARLRSNNEMTRHNEIGILLFTISFNKPDLIKYQYRLLKRNIEDEFYYLVADNSTDKNKSKEIEDFCGQERIPFIRLPKNFLKVIGSSYSHAASVNWCYKHVVSDFRPRIFGIIDHDLFPIKSVSISKYLVNQPFYGPLRERGTGWYLSGVMSFYGYEWTKRNGKFDYMPTQVDGQYLDTGGSNWWSYFRSIDKSSLIFPQEELEQFRDGLDYHGDYVQYFDAKNWVHLINGSGWKAVAEGKKEWMTDFLERVAGKG